MRTSLLALLPLSEVACAGGKQDGTTETDGPETQTWGTDTTEVTLPWPDGWSGAITILAQPSYEPDPPVAWASASFFEPGHGTHVRMPVIIHDPLEGADDCSLTEIGGMPLGAPAPPTPNAPTWTAGDVTLTLPDGTDLLLQQYGGQYGADLGPAVPGEYAFSATGDEVSSFTDLTVTLPEIPDLLEPEDVYAVPNGDLDLAWTGTSDLVFQVEFLVFDGATDLDLHSWIVHCELADDGAYTVPGSIIELLPAGGHPIAWNVVREDHREVVLDGGEIIGITGQAQASTY